MSGPRGRGRAGSRTVGRNGTTMGIKEQPKPKTRSVSSASKPTKFLDPQLRKDVSTRQLIESTKASASTQAKAKLVSKQPLGYSASWRDPEKTDKLEYSKRMSDLFQKAKAGREQERKDAIRSGSLADPDKKTSLAEAITPVGTCPDMCPEFERVERIVQNMADPCEKITLPDSDRKVPCEAMMVKRFKRSAAGTDDQIPSDIRPPQVLQRTLNYLLDEVVGGPEPLANVHKFVWDRTRAIRNDFSIQQVTRAEDLMVAIECFECIARFHIVSLHQLSHPTRDNGGFDAHQEREQLNNTLLSLMYYYDDSRGRYQSPNETEFRAYCIIFEIQEQRPDLEDRAQNWPKEILRHPRVQTALKLYAAAGNSTDSQGPLRPWTRFSIAQNFYGHFWTLISSPQVPYLMACVAEIYFNQIRGKALDTLWRSFKGARSKTSEDMLLSYVMESLGFDSEEQTQKYCEEHGFTVGELDNGEAYLILNSVSAIRDSIPSRPQVFSKAYVEAKRYGRSLPAVMKGYNIKKCRDDGLMDDVTSPSDDEELFVRDDARPPATKDPSSTSSFPSSSAQFSSTANPFAIAKTSSPQSSTSGLSSSIFSKSPFSTSSFSTSAFEPPSATRTVATNPFAKAAPQAPSAPAFPITTEKNPITNNLRAEPSAETSASANLNPFASSSQKSEISFDAPKFPIDLIKATDASTDSTQKPSDPAPLFISEQGSAASQLAGPQSSTFSSPQAQPSSILKPFPSIHSTSQKETSLQLPETEPTATAALTALGPPTKLAPSDSQNSFDRDTAPSSFSTQASKPLFGFSSQSQPTSSDTVNTSGSEGTRRSPAEVLNEARKLLDSSGKTKTTFSWPKTTSKDDYTSATESPKTFAPAPILGNLLTEVKPQTYPSLSPPNKKPPSSPQDRPVFAELLAQKSSPQPEPALASRNSTEAQGVQKYVPNPVQPLQAVRKPFNREEKFSDLAWEVTLGDSGILEQYIESILSPIVLKSMKKFRREEEKAKIAEVRAYVLAVNYVRRWRRIAWERKLAKAGKQRRRTLGKSLQELDRSTRSPPNPDPVSALLASNHNPAYEEHNAQASMQQILSKRASLPDATQTRTSSGSTSNGMLQSHIPVDRQAGQGSNHRRSQTMDENLRSTVSGRIGKREHLLAVSQARMLGSQIHVDDALWKKASRLASGKLDTTKTDYFRLKALGIDPATPAIPRTLKRQRISDGTSYEPRKTSRPSPPGASESPVTATASRQSSYSSSSILPSTIPLIKDVATPNKAKKSTDDDFEELMARVHEMKEAMTETTAWFREERERISRSRSQSAEPAQNGVHTSSRTTLRLEKTGAHGLYDHWKNMEEMRKRRIEEDQEKAGLLQGLSSRKHRSDYNTNGVSGTMGNERVQINGSVHQNDVRTSTKSNANGWDAIHAMGSGGNKYAALDYDSEKGDETKHGGHKGLALNLSKGASVDDAIEL